MRERSATDGVTLDSYIVSETEYEDLRKRMSGNWSQSDFADEHILFPERNDDYDYLTNILTGQTASFGRRS